MSIVMVGSTSGSITLQEPAVAGTTVINLPATSGTMAVTGGSPSFATLTVTGDASISGLTVGKGVGAISTNTVVGSNALAGSNTGANNAAFGSNVLGVNTSGAVNAGFGINSLAANTTGASNAGFGVASLSGNTTGSFNTAVGQAALQQNTTASNNTAVGYQAGYSGTTAYQNSIVGYQAGYNLTTGYNNSFIGYGSGYFVTTGTRNSVLGAYNGNQSGLDIRTASNHIVLSDGDGTWRMYFNASGAPFLGAVPSGSNSNLQWNSGTGAVTYVVSSRKYKTNIQDTKYGLADVLKMRAVTFNYISDGTPDIGVIAEEMVDVVPEIVGLKDGQPDYVGYERLSSVFINAIKELNAKVEAQALEIAQLKGN